MELNVEIPKRLRAQEKDRYMNYLRRGGLMMVQLEMEFDRRLDTERLAKAVDLVMDAEPVLGCRLVRGWWRPHWERLDNDKRNSLTVASSESEYESFKYNVIDAFVGPQIAVCLLRAEGGDRLLLKVAHEVSDAVAVRDIMSVMSSIYNRLAQESDYKPEPNLRGSRSTWQVFRYVPWYNYPRIYLNFYIKWANNMIPLKTFRLPVGKGKAEGLSFICRFISADRVARLKEYGRARDATLNDIILAAYFRALASVGKWDGRSQLRLILMVDIRRYRPDNRGEGICNLTGTEPFDYGDKLSGDFDATLKRVSAIMKRRKANWIGLSDCAGLAPFASLLPYSVLERTLTPLVNMSIKIGNGPDVITNMGIIDENGVVFDVKPVRARFIPPVNYPPHIVFSISSYSSGMDLCAGVWAFQNEQVERLFAEMLELLPE
ncbi:MAG: hypothetical protein U9N44_07830 [Chloroflexota bacterium]|nr:hypothetical protein [Chloroflexota bacterium]